MFWLREFEAPKKLHHRLPWALLVAPGVVLNKVGAFQTTIEYRGPDLYSATEGEMDALIAQVNNAFKRLGSGWAVFIEAQRRKTSDYPVSQWPNRASKIIDAERRKQFQKDDKNFANRYFLTLTYLPPSERVNKLASRFYIKGPEDSINYTKHLEYFKNEVTKIYDILHLIFPMAKRLDDDETLTYLHSTVSTKNHPIKKPKTPIFLDYLLTDQPLHGGLEPQLGHNPLKVFTIKGFPLEGYPNILSELGTVNCEFRWMTRFICMDRTDAVKELKSYSRKWWNKRKSIITVAKEAILNQESELTEDSDAVNKSRECSDLAEIVASGLGSAGHFTSTFVVWGNDRRDCAQKARSVEQMVNSAGFVVVDETYNCLQAWFGSLPGHCWANVRRPIVTSINLAHLTPTSADWYGPENVEHLNGPPLFFAKTGGNTPFRFSNMVGDVGHTFVVGPTGSGKSVLLSFMAASFMRYQQAEVVMFDKEFAALGITAAMGGEHYDLGEDTDISFQPLKGIENDMERSWAMEWLADILAQEGVQVNPVIKKELWGALVNLSTSPETQRTMTGLVTLTQSQTLRDALQTYAIEGPFGYLLDADKDRLHSSTWQCFEMDYLMNYTPGAVVPVLTYLFHKLDNRFKGNPTIVFLDEVWLYLNHPIFAPKIKEWLKTLRKRNVSVIFATQTISDVIDTPIVSILIDSCPTRIYLPNPKAHEETLYKQYRQFGLNDRQIEIITQGIPKKEYYCQSAEGNRKFDLDLGAVALTLCGSSNKKDISLMKELLNSSNGNEAYLRSFLEIKGVEHEEI